MGQAKDGQQRTNLDRTFKVDLQDNIEIALI